MVALARFYRTNVLVFNGHSAFDIFCLYQHLIVSLTFATPGYMVGRQF